jgi:hypothetical protein
MTAVQQFLGSEEYTRLIAEQGTVAFEQGADEMKLVALQLNPSLDAAKLVLPLGLIYALTSPRPILRRPSPPTTPARHHNRRSSALLVLLIPKVNKSPIDSPLSNLQMIYCSDDVCYVLIYPTLTAVLRP